MPLHPKFDTIPQPWKLQRRALLTGIVILGADTLIGGNRTMAAVEQNTLKRRGVGLRALDQERASPGFTLFAPHFVENRTDFLHPDGVLPPGA